ncbi:MAG: hypothetical protein H6560_25135 [Lewinellaceae bacterium]|nr:hypothetical protein [Lewinellaceae bacterium]
MPENHQSIELARARQLAAGLNIQVKLRQSSVVTLFLSMPIAYRHFLQFHLAYLRLKESIRRGRRIEPAYFTINNYLIQEHGYDILEMHGCNNWSILRIQMVIGQRKELLGCCLPDPVFENLYAFPAPYRFNTLGLFREKYASTPVIPSAIGPDMPFLETDRVYATPVTRFHHHPEKVGRNPMECRFLLDFSNLPFDLIRSMLDQIIVEFIWFTKGMDTGEAKAVLSANGFHSLQSLKGLEIYKSAYLFLAIKIHSADEGQEVFLELVKSFCELAPSQPIWNAIASDFYRFCLSSQEVTKHAKERVKKLTGAGVY